MSTLLLCLALQAAPTAPSALPPALELRLDEALARAGRPGGAHLDADKAWLVGMGWKAEVGAERARITPALGHAAPRALGLELSFEELLVDGQRLDLVGEGAPVEAAGAEARVLRGAGISEHWTAGAKGLELWLQVDELPRRGELRLRYDLGGELPLSAQDGVGADFRVEPLGGLRIDGVLGIDADGRTVDGVLWSDGDTLELSLPADFVRTARLPLVLDPLITPVKEIDQPKDAGATAMAYMPTTDTYLLAWEQTFAAGNRDISAMRRDANGDPVGFIHALALSSDDETAPTVGANPNTNEFVIAYQREVAPGNRDIHAHEYNASTGGVSFAFPVLTGSTDQHGPQLSDEWDLPHSDIDVLMIWRENGGAMRHGRLRHPTSGGPYLVVDGSFGDSQHVGFDLSASGGEEGVHLVTFGYPSSGLDNDNRLGLFSLSRDGMHLTTDYNAGWGFLGDVLETASVSDGDRFYTVELYRASVSPFYRLRFRILTEAGGVFGLPEWVHTVEHSDSTLSTLDAASAGGQIVVGWETLGTLGFSGLRYASVDKRSGVLCEQPADFPTSSLSQSNLSMASNGDMRALLAWTLFDLDTSDTDVLVTVFESRTSPDSVIDLGGETVVAGQAKNGGRAHAPCAYIGNDHFELLCRDTDPANGATLLIGVQTAGVSCGTGALVVDPWSAFMIKTVYSSTSDHRVAIPIPNDPNLVDVSLMCQWVTTEGFPHNPGCDLFGGVFLSNALRFTIE